MNPLGIADLLHSGTMGINMPVLPWYWCRQHERAENVQQPTHIEDDQQQCTHCVRVGPFMSAHEANRLKGACIPGTWREGPPLGMEIEV